jgi:hypothetical protein
MFHAIVAAVNAVAYDQDPVVSRLTRPKPAPVGSVDRGRITRGTGTVIVSVAAVIFLVRSLGQGTLIELLIVLLGLLVVPLVASPIEWFVHRYVYHQPAIPPLSAIFTEGNVSLVEVGPHDHDGVVLRSVPRSLTWFNQILAAKS